MQAVSFKNPPKCNQLDDYSSFFHFNVINFACGMAKKRSESAKEKKEKIPAATRGSRSNKTNGIAKRSSRSSTTRRTAVKGGLKATNVSSQRSQANRGGCKEESKQCKHLAFSDTKCALFYFI